MVSFEEHPELSALANAEMKIVGNDRSHMLFASMATYSERTVQIPDERALPCKRTPEAGSRSALANGAMSVRDV